MNPPTLTEIAAWKEAVATGHTIDSLDGWVEFERAALASESAMADQAVAIVERIMTQHWDMAACDCWVCTEGRAAGCRPREIYLSRLPGGVRNVDEQRPQVTVDR